MTDTGPIEVNGSLAPGATWQTLRVVLIFVGGLAVEHFASSGEVRAAGMAAVTVLLTYGYGIWDRFRSHSKQVAMAHALPDAQAVVK